MGERIQKIVLIVLALAFVAIIVALNTGVLTVGTSANKQFSSSVGTKDSALDIYDNKDVSGFQVITAAKDPQKISTTIQKVTVTTGNTTKTTLFYPDANEKTYNEPSSADTPGYINPNATFSSRLEPNANGVFVEIIFVQN